MKKNTVLRQRKHNLRERFMGQENLEEDEELTTRRSKLAETATKRNPLGASEAGSSSETYRLELLFQLPLDQVQPPVDFICSGSGVDVDTGRAFDRLCALRGGVVHILTFYLTEREGDGADDTPGSTPAYGNPGKALATSLELDDPAECAGWNSTASCLVVGDASGTLHFVAANGALLHSMQAVRPITRRDGPESTERQRAFHCIKLASSSNGTAGDNANSRHGAGQDPGRQGRETRRVVTRGEEDGQYEEILAVSASLKMVHFARVPLRGIEAACLAKNDAALRHLSSGITVDVVDVSSEDSGGTNPAFASSAMDACLHSGRDASHVYVVSRGSLSVWRREHTQRARPGRPRSSDRAPQRAASKRKEPRTGGNTEQEGAKGDDAEVVRGGQLEKMDEILAGDLFGGGGAVFVRLSPDARWMVVADNRGGLSWWTVPSLFRLARWIWSSTPGSSQDPGRDWLCIADMVILAGTEGQDMSNNFAGTKISSSRSAATAVSSTHPGMTARHGGVTNISPPCVACISTTGEVRVLRLGMGGVEELYRRPPEAASPVGESVMGTLRNRQGMLTTPSSVRHHFLLVANDTSAGELNFYRGKEAVPRYRLQAMLSRGDFKGALELARAHSMDETDVHVACLLSVLRAGGHSEGTSVMLGIDSAIGYVKVLLGRLGTPEALERVYDAVVEAPLPSLEDVRILLEIVGGRLRSFEGAGARFRTMMERVDMTLMRLRTFELIEGGRASSADEAIIADLASLSSRRNTSAKAVKAAKTLLEKRDIDEDGIAGAIALPRNAIADGSSEETLPENTTSEASSKHASHFSTDAPANDKEGSATDDSARGLSNSKGGGDKREESCFGGDGDEAQGGDTTIGDGGRVGMEPERAEVIRWLRFRTTDVVAFMGAALQAGDIHAASFIWRRHSRADRGITFRGKDRNEGRLLGRESKEGQRLVEALPGQLGGLPTGTPIRPLGMWLRDEVLPALDVSGAMAIRAWAVQHAREVETCEKRPHGALEFVHCVVKGSGPVLGIATEMMLVHSAALAAAEVPGAVAGLDAEHWKPWKRDSLDALGETLADLAHAWDAHGLRLPLSKFERLPRDSVVFRVLDRVQSPECLPREISHHVLPLARRYGLDPDAVLLDYMLICADAIRVGNRARRVTPGAGGGGSGSGSGTGGSGSGASTGSGAGTLLTEQRAVAVARCMSAGDGQQSELRSRAVLALANAASFPFSDGLRELVQDALSWGGPLEVELQDAARALRLSQIVQRYHVTGFRLGDAPRATRLLRHVLTQVHSPTVLDDALQVAKAYSHLHERNVYVEFLQNIASSHPGRSVARDGSTFSPQMLLGGPRQAKSDSGERARVPGGALSAGTPRDEGAEGRLGTTRRTYGWDSESDHEWIGDQQLMNDLAVHRARVTSLLRRLPHADARFVGEEVLLYLLRLLEELEFDGVHSGLKPGQLLGCNVPELGEEVSTSNHKERSVQNGDAVTVDAGSDAEEAVLVTAAASAVLAFLRELGHQPGKESEGLGAIHGDLVRMADNLRRISALQVEFGVFTSCATIRGRGDPSACSRGDHTPACWRILKDRLSGLEEQLHGSQPSTTATANGRGLRKKQGIVAQVPGGLERRNGALSPGIVGAEAAHKMRTLPRLLQRGRRLSELLGVAWPRVVSSLANEAVNKSRVFQAIGLCRKLFRDNRDKAASNEHAAALALRDTAVALSTFVASQSYSPKLQTDGQDSSSARAVVMQAMAQSVRGLRQSAALCGREELPLTVDLLQGSEAITAVLSRCEGGEELKGLISPPARTYRANVAAIAARGSRIHGGFEEPSVDALARLYKWYPGDGRVLPLEEALRLISRFVLQEMRLRKALVDGSGFVDALPESRKAGASVGAEAPLSTESATLCWEAVVEGASSPLLQFLQRMGAQQLCVRVIAGMAMPPATAVGVLDQFFSGLANKVLQFNHIDFPLAIGYMLALPTREGYDIFRRMIRLSNDDHSRLRTLARVGMCAARAWGNHDLLHQVIEVEQDAHWWYVLTSLNIPFDNRGFTSVHRDEVPGEYQRSLVPALLERSGGDLALTVDFCERYGVGEGLPSLLYVEMQLSLPCTSPLDRTYQARVTKVLPSVHGVFLARLIRRMLEMDTASGVNDRDYERLAFMYGLLLSEKCQEEDEDPAEEKERLADSLEALEILKAYTSPFPVDGDGRAAMPATSVMQADLSPTLETEAPSGGKDRGGEGGLGGSLGKDDVYSRRLPFRSLIEKPWAVLEPQLRPDSVAMLVPLAGPLRLSVSEFYARLVVGMLGNGSRGGGESAPAPTPVFSTLQPWLDKIKNSALACMTAQRVAAGMTRDADRLEAFEVAIKHAVAARTPDAPRATREEGTKEPAQIVTLLPFSDMGRLDVHWDLNNEETPGGAGRNIDVVEELEQIALRLKHVITVKEWMGDAMAERLSPYFSASSQELLAKTLLLSAEEAADKALASASGFPLSCSADNWSFEGSGGGGGMSDFRRKAHRALNAARAIADQRGLDPHDVETIVLRLCKGWICQPKTSGGCSSGSSGLSVGGGRGGTFRGLRGRGVGGLCAGESVFDKDAREERMKEDSILALRAAFVLTVTFTFSSDDKEGEEVCDSIAFLDLKSRISLLLGIAKDGRDGRVKFRARQRALLALSAIAPATLVTEVISNDKDKDSPAEQEQGPGLASLSDLRRNLGYLSELEEARLPHKLEELACCPPDDIVRALRRDHRREHNLIPLLCEMLLDARCEDTNLWSSVLADACRYPELCRVLILRVFPRVARSTVADAFARKGSILAPPWEEALRCPIEEMKSREERRRRNAATPSVSSLGYPSGPVSSSFGASLYAMRNAVDIPSKAAGASARSSGTIAGTSGAEFSDEGIVPREQGWSDWVEESAMAVIDQVVLLLGACPFPDRLDVRWFSITLAGLGPRFHKHAVRAALCIPSSAVRATVFLEAISAGVAASTALDELCPERTMGDSCAGARRQANQATLEAIFLDIDRRQGHAELDGTRHMLAMWSTLLRAGRSQAVVASYVARGRSKEAKMLCKMYYAAIGQKKNLLTQDLVENIGNPATAKATGTAKEAQEEDGAGALDGCALERFVSEFGLDKYPRT